MDDADITSRASIFVDQPPIQPPDGKYVSLTHAITWLAFRVSVSAEELVIDLERAARHQQEDARTELIRAVDRLTVAISDDLVRAVGYFVRLDRKSGERLVRTPIPADAMLEFRRFDMFVNGLQRGRGLAWRPLSEPLDTATIAPPGDEYHSLDVSRAGLLKQLKPNPTWLRKPSTLLASASATIPDDDAIRTKADEMKDRGLDGREIAAQMRFESGYEGVKVINVRAAIEGRYRRGPRKRPGAV